jgi:ATP-binding cassette, subfamily F, member 3
MLQLSSAAKRFAHKVLFEEVNWLITARERTALVGANGCGKSTLMKVLAGFEALDGGDCLPMKGLRVGYLPQDGLALRGRTVLAETMSVFDHMKDMERTMNELLASLSELDPESEEYRVAADRFSRLEGEFRNRDGYSLEAQAGMVLNGLGFLRDDWKRLTDEFSGGWQMRIALAKLLLEKPDLLLLDEPTNHLDLEARTWLEEYLQNYEGAFVLISHDRYFMDVTTNRIAELWNKRMTLYTGNYAKYSQQKDERLLQLQAAKKNQDDRIEQLESFINRFRAQATKAKQVQSRIKELEKIERIELPPEEKTIHFSFPQPKPSGRVVAEMRNAAKSYGERAVLRKADFVIERGDRIALVGVNGAGKSTLIRMMAGLEPMSQGTYKLGHNVEMDYFAQDQYKALDPEAAILDDLCAANPRATQTELRSLLGCFLFSEEDVFKKIGVLSGGERNRYALARLLTQPSNFVLLDEPTNHLDLRAKDVLLNALKEYTGTVVFVSHDRYFLDEVAQRVFAIEDGQVNIYPGNFQDYLRSKAGETAPAAPVAAEAKEAAAARVNGNAAARLNPQKLQKLLDRCQEVESQISRLEREIADIEGHFGQLRGRDEIREATITLENHRQKLQGLMADWEDLTQQIEAGR